MASKERRKARRFLLRLPLTVRWKAGLLVREAVTETRDVSSCGVYFHLPVELQHGCTVEIAMTLPKELTQGRSIQVRCDGWVVRSEPEESGNMGVVAVVERYELLRV